MAGYALVRGTLVFGNRQYRTRFLPATVDMLSAS